jgi:hypothetical protein
MSAAPQLDPLADVERLDVAADQAIAACDGDVRAAIRALLIANDFLERRNQQLAAYISVGFVRGQIVANNEFEDGLQSDLGEKG